MAMYKISWQDLLLLSHNITSVLWLRGKMIAPCEVKPVRKTKELIVVYY